MMVRTLACFGAILVGMGGLFPTSGSAQRLVEPRVLTLAPSYERWSFSTPFNADSFTVSQVSQVSLPIGISVSPVRNWRLDVSTSFTLSTLDVAGPMPGQASRLTLNGLTDTKARLVGRMFDDKVWLTVGLNVPTGLVRLSGEETAAIRVVGAPAFRMRTPALGSGVGAIAGAVFMTTVNGWAVGLGASYEVRGSYTPLEASLIGGGSALAELSPAEVVHVSLAFDRIVGQGRMSVLLVADRYGTDRVTIESPEETELAARPYQLGPTIMAQWQYQTAFRGVRDVRVWVTDRYRTEFKDATGTRVAGSSGNMLDVGASATVGHPGDVGISFGLHGVFDTGMDFENSVATAAMTSGRLTFGLDLLVGRLSVQPFASGTLGRLDLGPVATTATGFGGGVVVRSEW